MTGAAATAERVEWLAGRGDGVTGSGRYVALAAPGDLVRFGEGGEILAVEPGPHRVPPPCRHFPECGGCALQHVDDAAYAVWISDRVLRPLARQGIVPAAVEPPHLSPPRSRRRASLRALRRSGRIALGFNAEASHDVVDMAECHILAPALFALVQPLRSLLGALLADGEGATVAVTLTNGGRDLLLAGLPRTVLARAPDLAAFATAQSLARLSVDAGDGPETMALLAEPAVTLGGVPVVLPPGAFLQATLDGEAALVAAVTGWTAGARRVADLFAGVGTFALPLSDHAPVLAADGSGAAIGSLEAAARRCRRRVEVQHRDLFRRPLTAAELRPFDAVVLDPPRAGASAQCGELARSRVARVVLVSCNPATFARDAAALAGGGYRLERLRAVGQFRWSTHVELVALFRRP